jgi:hypothetical protein
MTNFAMKSIIIPDKVVSVYMHFAMFCLDGDKLDTWCPQERFLPENVSLVYHFRDELLQATDNITKEDKTLWKYKDELIKAVAVTLNATGFKP